MNIEKFCRLQYKSFFCLAFDTKNTRYWYQFSYPLYLEHFEFPLVDNGLQPDKRIKSIGTKKLSIQPVVECVCHFIHHVKVCLWLNKYNKREEVIRYRKSKGEKEFSLVKELFSNYEEHQYQIIG